jgi:HD-like signal output (HDOD) protein
VIEEEGARQVRKWLSGFFTSRHETTPARASSTPSPRPVRPAPPTIDPASGSTPLSAQQIEFLEGLLDPPWRLSLDQMPQDDRWFLGGVQKRWHARQLELPVLPAAAIRMLSMLRTGESPLGHFVELIESDSALTVELLRCANSAMFSAGRMVTSLEDGVRRIGLKRLESLLIMTHLKKKILKGSATQEKAGLLMDLVAPVGLVASQLTNTTGGEDHLSFLRGSLLHVEHMVILGAVTDVARDHKQPLNPSVRALLQACGQFGPEIRHAVATAWELQHVLLDDDDQSTTQQFIGFRDAVIARWLNRPRLELPDVDPARLEAALSPIAPRVPISSTPELAPFTS